MFFDPLYLLFMVPGFLLAAITALVVRTRFSRFEKVPLRSGLSGAEVAREILRRQGLSGVSIEVHEGFLSDHYDPTERVVRLSPKVYHGRSVAAAAVAAHEVGHAIQHAKAYGPMALRTASVPAANIGSSLSWILIFVGFIFQSFNLAVAGVALFGLVVFFQVITIPVEFNASTRAKAAVMEYGLVTVSEERDISKMLSAAALTYVAALVVALLQLVYFLIRLGLLGGSRND
ncbi:MAG: zinc metallopeptidase [Deltaproteobacteria bacterium]|nr:zinc metallopeptidase [Deltaproteobacteria bacterium]